MPSFGEELKRERELRRITLREVADATKINLRYLEALDRNDFKHLPGGVFNRGFVRAYAQYIGVDADQMVSAYLMEEREQSGTAADAEATPDSTMRGTRTPPGSPFGTGLAQETQDSGSGGMKPAIKVALVVAVLAAIVAASVFAYLRFVSARGAGVPAVEGPPGRASIGTGAPEVDSQPEQARLLPTSTVVERTDPVAPNKPVATVQGSPPVTQPGPSSAAPAATPRAAVGDTPRGTTRATVHIDRATTGRLNCDNHRIEILDDIRAGTRLELSCEAFLIVDAADGGALRIGWTGGLPSAPGEDGVPLEGLRIDPPRARPDAGSGR